LNNSFGISNTTNAGNHTLTVDGTLSNGNYNITQRTDGTWVINKAQAIITANSLNTVYNGKDQTATGFTAKGLVNGETESVLSNVSASVTGKDAGTYSNTATGTDSNYDLSFVDGSLNITKAKINQVNGITANNRVYDATTNATLNTSSAQFDGIMLGDELVVGNATGKFSDKNAANGKQVSINNISLIGADAHNYDLVNDTAQTTANINKANISSISGITANNRTYNGLTDASLNLGNVQFNGIYQGDDLRIESSIGKFDTAATGQAKMVSITGLSLSGADAQNYNLVDTNAQTQANIYMLIPEAYLQAIQFKRPRYLPDTSNVRNVANIEVRQGGVNTSGIQTLAGEH
ncbi:YDG domain-containing protein, partial [Acinetobacter sp. ULE_I010]|uniref:YDG domain-containing protein n=1 Tax=Acinetobacter sp. ULE_I010 TaxID=3373065 RepID=UPI003AF621B2